MECWAACLGDCDNVGSQEHIVSECLYPDQSVEVRGFPWCRENPKDLRIETLTQQILCGKGTMSSWALRWIGLRNIPVTHWVQHSVCSRPGEKLRSRHWSVKRFETEMLLLERWCANTLINTNHQGGLKYLDGSEPHSPPSELVEFVFGRKRFADDKGLYMVAEQGKQISM